MLTACWRSTELAFHGSQENKGQPRGYVYVAASPPLPVPLNFCTGSALRLTGRRDTKSKQMLSNWHLDLPLADGNSSRQAAGCSLPSADKVVSKTKPLVFVWVVQGTVSWLGLQLLLLTQKAVCTSSVIFS